MKLLFLPLTLFFIVLSSCGKLKENKIKNEQVCNSIPNEFSANKIANGCDDFSKNVLGSNSTVYLSIGCTGTVVAPHFIISASHCFYDVPSGGIADPKEVKIILGDNAFDAFNIKVLNVNNIFVNHFHIETNQLSIKHAYNNYANSDNYSLGDISLVQTEENLVEKYGLTAAKIAISKPAASEKFLSIGYGSIAKEGKTSGLKRWTLSAIGTLNFDAKSTKYNSLYNLYSSNVLSGNVSSNYDSKRPEDALLVTKKETMSQGQTCYGDSGGPQFIIKNGEALLISATQGVSRFWQGPKVDSILIHGGDICNSLDASLSTRIAPYIDWLNAKMQPANEKLVLVNN